MGAIARTSRQVGQVQPVAAEDAERRLIFRAYSMANHPAEGNIIMLNIRIATPPWDRAKNDWMDVNPASAPATCSAGSRATRSRSRRSVRRVLHQAHGRRDAPSAVVRAWPHAVAPLPPLPHAEDGPEGDLLVRWTLQARTLLPGPLQKIEAEFPTSASSWCSASRCPRTTGRRRRTWTTARATVHRFRAPGGDDQYLSKHEAPEDIEVYFCGPPLMNAAVLKMCDDWGIPGENVSFDDFGG